MKKRMEIQIWNSIGTPLPQLHVIRVGVATPINKLESGLVVSSIPRYVNGIGVNGIVPMTAVY